MLQTLLKSSVKVVTISVIAIVACIIMFLIFA